MKKLFAITLILCAILAPVVVYHAWGTPKQREVRHLARGKMFYDRGDYEKARIEYLNARHLIPTDPEADYRLGLVYEAQGDINNAFAGYSIAEQQDPHYHPALLKLANYYLAGEDYAPAQKRIDLVLADTPGDPEARALDASLRLHRKDYDGAEGEARQVLKDDPGNITAFSVLTGLYVAQKKPDLAGRTVDEGIARNPGNLPLLILKARVWEDSGDLARIDEAYQAIFRLAPGDDSYRVHLSDLYLAAGRTDEAEQVLRAAVKASPADLNLRHQLALFLDRHRGADAAEKEIRAFMQADPRNDAFYFWLADLYLSHNAADKAEALLEEITSRDAVGADALSARVSLARIRFVRGDKALAQKMLAFVLQQKPDDVAGLLLRAYIAFDEGRYQDAVPDLRAVIQEQPGNKEALQLLGEVYLRQRHLDLAIDTLGQLTEADPLDYAAKVRLAQMYDVNGNAARAEELLSEVTHAAPDYAVGWESMARVYIGAGDFMKAEPAIRALAAIHGQERVATFLEGQVEAGRGEPEKAIASFQNVIAADPDSQLSHHALAALVHTEQGRGTLEDAVTYIESLKTDDPYAMALLGQCSAALGRNDRAAAAFDKAIARRPADPAPYLARASLYLKAGNTEAALGLLKTAAAVAPGDVTARMMEAHILSGAGRYKEAIAVYDELLGRDPGLDIAANNLAAIIADDADADPAMLERARVLAERFIASPDPMLLDTLGWVYYRQGNFGKALLLTIQARQQRGNVTPQVHYHYGAILLHAGRREEAKSELQQAVESKERYPGDNDARHLLEGLVR